MGEVEVVATDELTGDPLLFKKQLVSKDLIQLRHDQRQDEKYKSMFFEGGLLGRRLKEERSLLNSGAQRRVGGRISGALVKEYADFIESSNHASSTKNQNRQMHKSFMTNSDLVETQDYDGNGTILAPDLTAIPQNNQIKQEIGQMLNHLNRVKTL